MNGWYEDSFVIGTERAGSEGISEQGGRSGAGGASLSGWLLAAIIVAAVLTPAATLTSGLPDVRLEQALALPAVGLLVAARRRHPSVTRLGLIDLGFAALAGATLISVVYAPLALGEAATLRDGYEVVKLCLYWVLFRVGLLAGGVPANRRRAFTALFAAGSLSALVALAQYVDVLGVVERTGGWWAPAHHLRTLVRDGRAFGTVGNPNYFGMMMALTAVMALTWLASQRARPAVAPRRQRGPAPAIHGSDRPAPSGRPEARGGSSLEPSPARRPDDRLIEVPVVRQAVSTGTPPSTATREPRTVGISRCLQWRPRQDTATLAAWYALALATMGVVLSGSRGALGAVVAAVCVLWVVALVRRASRRELLTGSVVLCAAFAAAVLVVEMFPRGREDYLTRVAGAFSPTAEGSLGLRIERWRGVTGTNAGRPSRAGPGAARTDSGRPSAGPDARERDSRRKAGTRAIVAAVTRHRDATGRLPDGPSLDELVPDSIDSLPSDPLSGAAYDYQRTAAGFTVAARIEDPADLDYPLFAIGTVRTYIDNGDLEEGRGGGAAGFRALPGTAYRRDAEAALFGESGIIFRGNPRDPGQRAAVYQQRYLNRTGGGSYTAAVWVKLPRQVSGDVFLYTNIFYTDGERRDPHAKVAADSALTGVWQRLAVTITPDPGRRIDFIGVYLLSDSFSGEAYADGFVLVDGRVPVSFPGLEEAGAATTGERDAGAVFRRSPVFGAGPGKAENAGTLDNEYLVVATRYGIVGLVAYLLLWGAVIGVAWRGGSELTMQASQGAGHGEPGTGGHTLTIRAAVAAVVAGLLVFNLVAGSLYHLQLMGLFWPLAGAALAEDDHPAAARDT